MKCFAHGLSHVFSTLTRQLGISLLLKFSQPRFFYLLHQNVEGRLCLISKGQQIDKYNLQCANLSLYKTHSFSLS